MKKFFSLLLTGSLAFAMITSTATFSEAKTSRSTKCKIYANKQVDRMVNRTVGTGLAVGAGTGLLVGALLGKKSVVPGLAVGAIGGTVTGAVVGAEKRKKTYRRAYANCMDY